MIKVWRGIFVLLTMLSPMCATAQIPNANFANWPGAAPAGWTVTSNPASTTVIKSHNAHSDTLAVQLNVVSLGGPYTMGGALHTGGKSGYFLNWGNFTYLKGWYILNMIDSADQLLIKVGTKCSNNTVNGTGSLSFFLDSNTAVYKEFVVNLNYRSGWCGADSATIDFEVVNFKTYEPNVNSWAIIDDLSFGPLGIDEEKASSVRQDEVFPNPANNSCNIIYSVPSVSAVSIALYDISGRRVKIILNDTRQTPGRYKIPLDVRGFPNGVYFYSLLVNGAVYSQRLTIAH